MPDLFIFVTLAARAGKKEDLELKERPLAATIGHLFGVIVRSEGAGGKDWKECRRGRDTQKNQAKFSSTMSVLTFAKESDRF